MVRVDRCCGCHGEGGLVLLLLGLPWFPSVQVMYGRLEEANACIESLLQDKDPLLRRAGAFTIATAYCGTASNAAVRQLLHVGVSDVDDNVRRSAIASIGFVLFRSPEQCPSMVALLLESYNPHMRAGALMAMGVACSGTGSKVRGGT